MRFLKVIPVIYIVLLSDLSFAQYNNSPGTHLIVMNFSDSVIHANILIVNPQIKMDNSKTYFWYSPDQIYTNQGGYSGYLLHGQYKVYDKKNHLLVQGSFNKGLKTEVWKYWSSNGSLKEVIQWKEGLLNGNHELYNLEGSVVLSLKYRKGKLVDTPKEKKDVVNTSESNMEIINSPVDSTITNK